MNQSSIAKASPIVEIIGPAGSGKSTLADHLCECDQYTVKGERLRIRRLRHLSTFMVHALATLPTALSLRHDSKFCREDVKKMVVLRGWDNVLQRQSAREKKAIILDQGPIYRLAMLLGFGPSRLHAAPLQPWWNSMFEAWANALGVVVWLDAPDSVLLRRIDTREKNHSIKSTTAGDARKFLATYRNAFETVIANLKARSELVVLRCDTSCESLDSIRAHVSCALREYRASRDTRSLE